jgi:hypothetical protein
MASPRCLQESHTLSETPFLYPCTLKVLPLAVFRSFSSFSGLARLSTEQVRSSLRNVRQGQYIPCRKSAVRLLILEWM